MRDDATNSFLGKLGGLVITLAVIGFLFLMWNVLKGSGDEALSKATDMTDSIMASNITQYNRSDISGTQVLNAITTFMDSSDEIFIKVDGVCYIYPNGKVTPDGREKKSATLDKINAAKQKGSATYIKPKGKYTGKIIYMDDDESVIEGIEFTVQ